MRRSCVQAAGFAPWTQATLSRRMLNLVLVQPPVVADDARNEARFSFKRDLKRLREWKGAGYNVEVRMCILDNCLPHNTWPRAFQFGVNGRKVIDIQPPQGKEERKDAPEKITRYLGVGVNKFTARFEDDNVQRFALALVRTMPKSSRDIIKQVPIKSAEECKERLTDYLFSSKLEGSGSATVKSICPVSESRMKTPARGLKCLHIQCFDLSAYLLRNLGMDGFNQRWHCPVCKIDLKPRDLFIDTYMMQTLKAAGRRALEVAFDEGGDWNVTASAEGDSESEVAEDDPVEDGADDANAGADGDSDGNASDEADLPVPEGSPEASPSPDGEEAAAAAPEVRELTPEEKEALRRKADLESLLRPEEPVDPMDEMNYIVVELTKPMGIIFEGNQPRSIGGIYIAKFDDDGVAAQHGRLKVGDQLVGVGGSVVKGKDFDTCIDEIVAGSGASEKLTVFRGDPYSLYGQGDECNEWLRELLVKVGDGTVKAAPPVEKRKSHQRLSMPVSEGSEGSEDEEEEEEDDELLQASGVSAPSAISACITGAGLEKDFQKCVQKLPELKAEDRGDGITESSPLTRAILRACVDANAGAWKGVKGKRNWLRTACRRLAATAAVKASAPPAAPKPPPNGQQQERSSVAMCGRSSSKAALLRVDPAKDLKFDRNNKAQLTVQNTASGYVAFRVRTTAPQLFMVEPSTGTLSQGEELRVQIRNAQRANRSQSVKFLVQAIPAPKAGPVAKEVWTATEKDAIQEWCLGGAVNPLL